MFTLKKTFKYVDLIPDSSECLSKYFRIPNKADDFYQNLSEEYNVLAKEAGIYEALQRWISFPLPLPQSLIEVIQNSNRDEQKKLIKRLLQAPSSPLSIINIVRILGLLHSVPCFSRLQNKLLRYLSSQTAKIDTAAFLSIIKWLETTLQRARLPKGMTTENQLLLRWAHAHRIYSYFICHGETSEHLVKVFREIEQQTLSTMFDTPIDKDDTLKISNTSVTEFLLYGIAYSSKGLDSSLINEEVKRAVREFAFVISPEAVSPNVHMFKSTQFQTNYCSSFLHGEKEILLKSLLTEEELQKLSESGLKSILLEYSGALKASPENFDLFLAVLGMAHDLPFSDVSEELILLLEEVDYLQYAQSEDIQRIYQLLNILIFVSIYLGKIKRDKQKSLYNLEMSLYTLAKYLSEQYKGFDKNNIELHRTFILLLECAYRTSIIKREGIEPAKEFSRLAIGIISNFTELAKLYKPVIQMMCEELPFDNAIPLWKVNFFVRAMA